MKLIGLMACRNSDWVLGLTARAALMWCDSLVLRGHDCTDRTCLIVSDLKAEYGDRLIWLYDKDPVWREMKHRQEMLESARLAGATHLAYCDDDEALSGNLLPCIRQWAEALPAGTMLSLPWLQLRGSIDQVMTSGMWAHQHASTVFRDSPELHWAARGGYDFHCREPLGCAWRQHRPVHNRAGGLIHLQFLSERRLRAKQALYKMQEVTRWPGRKPVGEIDAMYSRTAHEAAAAACSPAPAEWWAPYQHLLPHLHIDAEPWQEAEARRLYAEHGAETFRWLDLFGVVE